MRNSKNQFSHAELKFSYAHYPELLMLGCTFQASDLLLKLWNEQCKCAEPRRYVLFLNVKNQLITWKQLPVDVENTYHYYAREIAGMAVACNASSIILSHHRLTTTKPNLGDKELMAQVFKICGRFAIEILDYLIITPTQSLSYRAWLGAN